MKRMLLLACAFVLGMSVSAQQKGDQISVSGGKYTVVSDNLFINGSFSEDDLNGWKTVGYTEPATEASCNWMNEGGFDGGAYVITNGAGVGSTNTLRQSIAVTPGKTYYFAVYTSGTAPASTNFNYNALFKMKDAVTEDGVLKAFEWPQGASVASTTWSKTEFTFVPDEAHPYVGVRMGWNASSSFDGFMLFEIEEAGVDVTLLTAEITKAQALLATFEAGAEWHTALQTAITEAEAAKASASTAEEVVTATDKLKAAETAAEVAYKKASVYASYAEGKYLLKNVSAAAYLVAGNSWGTQASLSPSGEYVTLHQLEDGKYRIETQVSNGGEAYYFNGSYMDAGATSLELIKKGDKVLITNGAGQYYGAPAEGTAVAALESADDEAALWQVISFEDAKAGLSAATEDESIDATFLMLNPQLGRNNRNTTAWVKTGAASDPKTSGTVGAANANFLVEAYHGVFDFHQDLTDIPNGLYDVYVGGFNRDDSNGAEDVANYGMLYANNGVAEVKQTLAAHDAVVNSMEAAAAAIQNGQFPVEPVRINVTHNSMTLGVKGNSTQLWTIFDGFRLVYLGKPNNAGQLALDAAIETLVPYADNYETTYVYSTATNTAVTGLLAEARDFAGDNEQAYLDEANKIGEMVTKVKGEIAEYDTLKTFVAQVNIDKDKYAFITDLATMAEEYEEAYNDRTATVENINAWTSGYRAIVVAGIKAALPTASADNVIEVTYLFPNLGFEENKKESTKPTNWESNSAAFKARANVAEVWNVSFDAHATLTDLPKGAYRITAHALGRSGSSVDNYNAFVAGDKNITAEMYANNVSTKLVSQAAAASATKLQDGDANVGTEEAPLYVPNSMEGARVYFNAEATPYVSELATVISKDGDPLVIGFRDNGTNGTVVANSWTVWSDVRVFYTGVNNSALKDEMMAIYDKVAAVQDQSLVVEANNKLNDAAGVAEDVAANASATEEEITAAIDQLNAALAYNDEAKTLVAKIIELQPTYTELVGQYTESTDTNFPALVDEVSQACLAENFESNEQIKGWIENLPKARTKYVYAAVVDAQGLTPSETTPVNVTAVMNNASFDEGTNDTKGAFGWTMTWKTDGGHIGYNTVEQQQLSGNAFEYWKLTAFEMSQTIVGLPDGFYRISCNGFYRPGNNNEAALTLFNEGKANDMSFFVNDQKTPMACVYAEAVTEALGAAGEVNVPGTTDKYVPNSMESAGAYFKAGKYLNQLTVEVKDGAPITVGLKLDGNVVDANWCMFDNFKIEALGTTTPTAVERVENNATSTVSAIYNVNGQQQSRLQKGFNIVRRSDGKVIKLMVK